MHRGMLLTGTDKPARTRRRLAASPEFVVHLDGSMAK